MDTGSTRLKVGESPEAGTFFHILKIILSATGVILAVLSAWDTIKANGLTSIWQQTTVGYDEQWKAQSEKLQSLQAELRRRDTQFSGGVSAVLKGEIDQIELDGQIAALGREEALAEVNAAQQRTELAKLKEAVARTSLELEKARRISTLDFAKSEAAGIAVNATRVYDRQDKKVAVGDQFYSLLSHDLATHVPVPRLRTLVDRLDKVCPDLRSRNQVYLGTPELDYRNVARWEETAEHIRKENSLRTGDTIRYFSGCSCRALSEGIKSDQPLCSVDTPIISEPYRAGSAGSEP